ncbi:hypothetical protein INR49_003489 [Caranx melampygus]|nr:hypothetical protein INR49_003489 [Caranx melampygus]
MVVVVGQWGVGTPAASPWSREGRILQGNASGVRRGGWHSCGDKQGGKAEHERERERGGGGGVDIAETYAFLPREAVTRFLMSCGECQKRMHINPSTAEFKENDRPTSLVPDLIDYNMPLTATYLKQMKLQCMTTTERAVDGVGGGGGWWWYDVILLNF